LRLAGALEQGQVAAAVLGDPWVTRLAGEGGGVLADLRTRAGARRWLGAETVHAAVFVRPDSKLSERELTAVARALLRAVARLSGPGAVAQVAGRKDAGRGGGHPPRNTRRRDPLPPLTWGHEIERSAAFDFPQKIRFRGECPPPLPAPLLYEQERRLEEAPAL